MENVKLSTETRMLFTINCYTFYSFMKNIWIGDSGTSCHIMYNNTGLFDVINIDESIQGSFGNMPGTKKGKLCISKTS